MCVVCIRNKSNSFTTYYCGLCTVTSTKGYERNPSKYAYFMYTMSQYFAKQVSICYSYNNNYVDADPQEEVMQWPTK